MLKLLRIFPYLCMAALVLAQDPREQLAEELRKNRRLEMEYALVKNPQLYVVFCFSAMRIEFHMRGMLVGAVPIQDALVMGNLPKTEILLTLRIKETPRVPQRYKVNPAEWTSSTTTLVRNPGSQESSPPKDNPAFSSPQYNEPAMLELKDMPTRYNLVFDGGLAFMIRPAEVPVEEKGFQGYVKRWGVWWSDVAAELRRRMGRPQVPQLRLTLSEDACRWIFWAVSEETKFLYVP